MVNLLRGWHFIDQQHFMLLHFDFALLRCHHFIVELALLAFYSLSLAGSTIMHCRHSSCVPNQCSSLAEELPTLLYLFPFASIACKIFGSHLFRVCHCPFWALWIALWFVWLWLCWELVFCDLFTYREDRIDYCSLLCVKHFSYL